MDKAVLFFMVIATVFQILVYIFYRSWRWITNGKIGKKSAYLLFILYNIILALSMARVFDGILEIFATTLSLLWIWLMCAFSIFMAYQLFGKRFLKIEKSLKIILPLLFLSVSGFAYYQAYSPVVVRYAIEVNKPIQPLNIALIADTHLGHQMGVKEINRLNELLQAEKPDVVLMAGDIINDNPNVYYRDKMESALSQIKAPLGVIGVLGNHEYYNSKSRDNPTPNIKALLDGGVKLLIDEGIQVRHDLWIIGRDDYTNKKRPDLKNILEKYPIENHQTVIVLDHQPRQLKSASELNVDIHVSGHTHKGQLFPMNYLVDQIYPLSYGHEKINSGHFFVTSGYGFWGSAFRLGSRAEIMMIEVRGK